MGSSLIIDNWLLQDVGACIASGLNTELSSELIINRKKDSHSIREVPSAGVEIEALLSLLADVVLRDSLIFDSAFTNAWKEYQSLFVPLVDFGLMRGLPFKDFESSLKAPKKFALSQLCVTSSIQDIQSQNEESWRQGRGTANPYMSALVWGTAGMLSRSHVFESPYSGHPLRKRLIEQAMMLNNKHDIIAEFQGWVMNERLKLFETKNEGSTQRSAMIVLPPVVVEVIEESKDVSDLVPVALQLRDKYMKTREWLKPVQEAVESEDAKTIAKYKKTLDIVSKDIDREINKSDAGKVTLKLGFCMPSISVSLGTLDGVMKNFGIRSTLNDQIFTKRGEKSLNKLLRMFGEEKSPIGLSVQNYFRERQIGKHSE